MASMRQVPFSDHNLLWMELVPFSARMRSAYWHFNNQLLEDERFQDFSPFFYLLEKRHGVHKQLLVLLADDRSLISDPEDIRAQVRDYYMALFSLDLSTEEARKVLWEHLLRLSPKDAERLGAPLSLEEHISTLDRLSMGTALSTHLGTVLDRMIYLDQSYTVPGQSIHNNIHLVWDVIPDSQRAALSNAFLSLNQEKVFDRIDHEYLLETLWWRMLRYQLVTLVPPLCHNHMKRLFMVFWYKRQHWVKLRFWLSRLRRAVHGLHYDMQFQFVEWSEPHVYFQELPVFYLDLIIVWDMVGSRQSALSMGVVAVRELLLRNRFLVER
eukprot:g31754.t1